MTTMQADPPEHAQLNLDLYPVRLHACIIAGYAGSYTPRLPVLGCIPDRTPAQAAQYTIRCDICRLDKPATSPSQKTCFDPDCQLEHRRQKQAEYNRSRPTKKYPVTDSCHAAIPRNSVWDVDGVAVRVSSVIANTQVSGQFAHAVRVIVRAMDASKRQRALFAAEMLERGVRRKDLEASR